MRRRLWYAAVVFLIAAPLGAQRAQLARKGRQPDSGRPQPSEGIRKLPRRITTNLPVTPAPVRRAQAPRPLSEDRSRPLLRGDISPLSAGSGQGSPHALPRRTGALIAGYAAVPVVDAAAVPNRWQIFPAPPYRRYADKRLAAIQTTSRFLDPYNRNTYKGDYPIAGRRLFFAVTAVSESTAETRRIPVPSVPSSSDAGEFGFFGRGEQSLFQQNFRLSFDLFRGSAGFEPVELEVKVTPEFNINYAAARENGLLAIDVRPGTHRTDTAVGMQELYVEKRLFAGKAFFDFTSVRAGIQRFTSDFRGLIFSDEQPGARLFGNFHNNVFQYNLAYFNLLEKDANSGLNHWQSRRQQVWAANLYWSDFLTKGYTLNFSALYNHDQPSFLVDKNGFLVRPAPVGFPSPHKVRAAYAGISGEGHIKRINVSHAFYQAFGRDDFNPIPARNNAQHINAQLAFVEAGYERDWMEWKASIFYTSGDKNLNDGHANGFDGIVPNQQIAGGGFLGNPVACRSRPAQQRVCGRRQQFPESRTDASDWNRPVSLRSQQRDADHARGPFRRPGEFHQPRHPALQRSVSGQDHAEIPCHRQYELGQIQSHRSPGGPALPKPHTPRGRPRHGCRHAVSSIADGQHRSYRRHRRAGPRRRLPGYLYRTASLFSAFVNVRLVF